MYRLPDIPATASMISLALCICIAFDLWVMVIDSFCPPLGKTPKSRHYGIIMILRNWSKLLKRRMMIS